MNYIYVVQYNNSISKECYTSIDKAIDFVMSREGNPKQICNLVFKDESGNTYSIHTLSIK